MFLIAALAIFLFLGFYSSRGIKDLGDYGLSRGHFSRLFVVMTVVASFVGGGTVLGTMEKVASTHSFSPVYALFGYVLQLIFTGVLLAKYMIYKRSSLTIGDFFHQSYGSTVRRFVGMLWLVFTLGAVAIQIRGMGQMMSSSMGYSVTVGVLIAGGVVTIYCFLGGIRAVVVTDFFQCLLMVGILSTFAFYIMWQLEFSQIFNKQTLVHNVFFGENGGCKVFSAFFGFLLGDALIPPIVQRVLMCKTEKQARFTMVWGGVISLFLILAAAVIGLGIMLLTQRANFIEGMHNFVNTLPELVRAIFYLGFFAVLISSADTYINAASITWAQDVVRSRSSNLGNLTHAKWATLFLGVGSMFLALYVESLFDFTLLTYKIWGPFVVVPFLGLLFGKVVSLRDLSWIFIYSVVVIICWWFWGIEEKTGISDLVPCMLGSGLLFCWLVYQNKRL